MLHSVQTAAPGAATPARAPLAVAPETPVAVPGAADSARTGTVSAHDAAAEAERRARELRTRAADPTLPLGPPPAFAANVLEAERARRSVTGGSPPGASEPAWPAPAVAPHPGPADAGDPPLGPIGAGPASQGAPGDAVLPKPVAGSYVQLVADTPRRLDLAR